MKRNQEINVKLPAVSGVPFLKRAEDERLTGGAVPTGKVYFDYIAVVRSIVEFLRREMGCEPRLYYQEDSNEAWEGLEEDIRSGYTGVKHVASLYDLVETDIFSFESEQTRQRAGYGIRPSIRNNLFLYPAFGVAFARIPREIMHGIGYEDLIFATDNDGLDAFLSDMRKRGLSNRKVILFCDTRNGLDQERTETSGAVERDEVFMDEALKTHIYRTVDEFFTREGAFFRTYGIPYKRGILLYGKPGNGKTTLVKSIAATASAPVAYWQITEFTNSESIAEVFAAADRMAPMVLVIEDIDSMPESCRSFFLNTLDGASSKEGIFLIGTTNYPEKIDPALMNRAGRFDRAYEIRLPDEALRHAYMLNRGMVRLADADTVARAARDTAGFSFAQLGELYVSAALQLHYEGYVDLKRLIDEMKTDFAKSRSGDWMSDGKSNSLGFV